MSSDAAGTVPVAGWPLTFLVWYRYWRRGKLSLQWTGIWTGDLSHHTAYRYPIPQLYRVIPVPVYARLLTTNARKKCCSVHSYCSFADICAVIFFTLKYFEENIEFNEHFHCCLWLHFIVDWIRTWNYPYCTVIISNLHYTDGLKKGPKIVVWPQTCWQIPVPLFF